jgi:hypothetical protein
MPAIAHSFLVAVSRQRRLYNLDQNHGHPDAVAPGVATHECQARTQRGIAGLSIDAVRGRLVEDRFDQRVVESDVSKPPIRVPFSNTSLSMPKLGMARLHARHGLTDPRLE